MGAKIERYGTGEKVVFIHGAGGSTKSWFFQRELLKAPMEVILVDLPGHGKAESHGGCATIDEMRDSVREVLKSSGIDRCWLVGHSMGSAVAMSCALAFPDMLKGIVLIGAGAKLKVFPEILEGIMKDKEKTLRNIMDFAFSKTAPESLKESGFREMLQCSAGVIFRDFSTCNHFNVMGTVSSISAPTLIICGEEDSLTPPKYSLYLHEQIKGSELVVIEGAGHMAMLEKPEAVSRAIREFVVRQNKDAG